MKIFTSHEALFHHSITSNLNKRNRERLSLGVLISMLVYSIITTSLSNEHPQRNASKPNNERISDIATANSIKACLYFYQIFVYISCFDDFNYLMGIINNYPFLKFSYKSQLQCVTRY